MLGIEECKKIHENVELPYRKTKNNPLTKEQRKENQKLMSNRAVVENVIGLLKRFKIIADRYRNRRERFGLRFNLISGIYNWSCLFKLCKRSIAGILMDL